MQWHWENCLFHFKDTLLYIYTIFSKLLLPLSFPNDLKKKTVRLGCLWGRLEREQSKVH